MKVILHIGTPKTGSTTLQLRLLANYEALAESRVLYPQSLVGYGPGHIGLYWLTLSPHKLDRTRFVTNQLDPAAFQKVRQNLRDELFRELDRAKPETLIISSEHLTYLMPNVDNIRPIRGIFDELQADVKIHAYLRDQSDLLPSLYNEEVVAGLSEKFRLNTPPHGESHWDMSMIRLKRAMIDDPNLISYIDPTPFWLDYKNLLNLWATVFGKNSITPFRFGEQYLDGGDIVSDFSHRIGVPLSVATGESRVNSSDSAATTELRRYINKILRHDVSPSLSNRRRSLLKKSWLKLPGKPLSLSPEQVNTVKSTFELSNKDVAATYFNGDQNLFG